LRLERDVALKVMLSRYAEDPVFSERFMQEARISANLNHQNVVQIYDVNRHEGSLYLAMEYISGGELSTRMRSQRDKQDIIKVIEDLSSALDFAHARGYIHRDVKPANILFREDGSLALSDFGIARAIHRDSNMTQTGMVVGTPSYMSPEQAQGEVLSGSADLYSLAVIAY
jgi:serine/threonine-protein kinase PpkA